MKKVIAIDGPSGSGKSTVAKLIAKELSFDYLDTGALYRAVALNLMRLDINENASDRKILSALKKTKVEFKNGRISLNGKDVSQVIRSPEAGHYASVFSARKPVREYLMKMQRDASKITDLVAEGRDMTTVVFPDSHIKFYLDASVKERTRRRTLEFTSKGYNVDENQIRLDIIERDIRDSNRDVAPLKKTDDACYIDSTNLSIEDVFKKMMEIIRETINMEIFTAKRAGFCFGVKRAIDITSKIAKKNKKGVYTLGPLIHNPQVIEKLKDEGIFPIDNIDNIENMDIHALIIRTHGIPYYLYDNILSQGFKIIDATCPFVKKAQNYTKLLKKNGYQVVILGDSNHPEVRGLKSYAGEDVIVADENISLKKIKPKVGIVVQTTQSTEALKNVLSKIIEHAKEIKVYNTICSSTALRLKETKDIAQKVDIMIVVGGKNSSNTTQLAKLCRSLGVRTYHVETASEIKNKWFDNIKRVGITGGASTPNWIIDEVENRIRDIGGKSCNGNRKQ